MSKVMRFFQTGIPKFYKVVVASLFWLILFFLAFLSIFGTCFMDVNEKTYFCSDSVWLNVCAVLVVLLLFIGAKIFRPISVRLKKLEENNAMFLRCRRILLTVLFLLGLIWVLATQYNAISDQYGVQSAAYGIKTEEYSSFELGGYISTYPNQFGLMWISYLFAIIFGSYNYIAFQIMNVFGLVLLYRELSEIGRCFGWNKCIQLLTIVVGILFFPPIMYCSFVYGNIMGLAFSVLAIRLEFVYFQKHRPFYAVGSAASIMVAMLFKSNYLIFFIGMFLYAVVEIIAQKKWKAFLLPLLLVVAFFLQSWAPMAIARQVTGEKLDQSASSWSWIAMGLQSDSQLAPGWYNLYNQESYNESGYNTQRQTEMAKANIAESLHYFWNHKGAAVKFFTEKTASQWNNPTFQCYWITVGHEKLSLMEQSEWVEDFTSPSGAYHGALYLNLLQFIILFGVLIYCIVFWKKPGYSKSLLLGMIFVGGFLFHLVWEAKGQYTLSYFVLLIPLAVAGFSRLTDQILLLGRKKYRAAVPKKMKRNKNSLILFSALTVIMIFAFVICYAGGRGAYLTEDTAAYQQYLVEFVPDSSST